MSDFELYKAQVEEEEANRVLRDRSGAVLDNEDAITEEDAWTVISAHFASRGLVSQQLDSFDVFMCQTMQVSYFN